MMQRGRKAQNVLEYTLFLAAIIAVIMLVLFGSGGFQGRFRDAYTRVGDATNNTAQNLNFGIFNSTP